MASRTKTLSCSFCRKDTVHRYVGDQEGADSKTYYELYNCNTSGCDNTRSLGPFNFCDSGLEKKFRGDK